MLALPKHFLWLSKEPGPRILVEALKTYGTIEKPGAGSNPSILQWAKVTGLDRQYRSDATAWCGLWAAYVSLQAGWELGELLPVLLQLLWLVPAYSIAALALPSALPAALCLCCRVL